MSDDTVLCCEVCGVRMLEFLSTSSRSEDQFNDRWQSYIEPMKCETCYGIAPVRTWNLS